MHLRKGVLLGAFEGTTLIGIAGGNGLFGPVSANVEGKAGALAAYDSGGRTWRVRAGGRFDDALTASADPIGPIDQLIAIRPSATVALPTPMVVH